MRPISLFLTCLAGTAAIFAFLRAQEPPAAAPDTKAAPTQTPAPASAAPAGTSPVDSLTQTQMQEIFQVLQKQYVKPEAFNDAELNRAAIQGLLTRLGGGISLETRRTDGADTNGAAALVAEELTPSVVYLRPGVLTSDELPRLDAALDSLAKTKAHTLLLDLRSPARDGDYAAAAQILSRFLPEAEVLFQIRRASGGKLEPFVSKGRARWTRDLMLLVDGDTNNVAEVVAAVLQARLRPFVIGSRTRGMAAQMREVPIGKDLVLRFADAEVVLAEGRSLFRIGVQPDMEAPFESDKKRKIFAASATEGMKKFVFEKERPRMNEAALVARSNPELDYQIAKSAGKATSYDGQPLCDRAIQQALDVLTSSAILDRVPAPPKNDAPPE
jgi:C-terminal processing protease CtpA/Prc